MTKTIFRYGIAIVLVCIGVLTVVQLCNKKTGKVAPVIEQRDATGIDPFTQAARVQLVTYKTDRMAWWIDTYGTDWAVVENGMLTMPADSIRSIKELDANQMAEWQHALYVRHFCQDTSTAPQSVLTLRDINKKLKSSAKVAGLFFCPVLLRRTKKEGQKGVLKARIYLLHFV